jgi:hypothetical protein
VAYTEPTFEQFATRFPNFSDMDENQFSALLTEAKLQVDDSWLSQTNYTVAIMYLIAHLKTTDQSQEGESGVVGGAGSGGIASESFGGMSISYNNGASASDAAANSQWGSTEYGRRFYNLLKRNKPAIVSV